MDYDVRIVKPGTDELVDIDACLAFSIAEHELINRIIPGNIHGLHGRLVSETLSLLSHALSEAEQEENSDETCSALSYLIVLGERFTGGEWRTDSMIV